LRISSLTSLKSEREQQLQAQQASEAAAPRITRVFPISYANLTDLHRILVTLATGIPQTVNSIPGPPSAAVANPQAAIGGGSVFPNASATIVNQTTASSQAPRSNPKMPNTAIEADHRTNSLIVRDIAPNVERMRKLIEILDTQTPQVMIEAKVVEAEEGFGSSVGGGLGINFPGGDFPFSTSFLGANPITALVGSAAGPTPVGNSLLAFSPNMSFLNGNMRLNAFLNLAEQDSSARIIASPKTVVLDKETATIVSGTPVLVPGSTVVPGVGTVATTTVQSANLNMTVTPSVTNDGGILMQLALSRDVPSSVGGGAGNAISTRNMTTRVLVESGSTLVIGGIYTLTNNHTSSGLPYLRKIPILGRFFGSETETTDKSELFFFITPRILNPKEAGLNG